MRQRRPQLDVDLYSDAAITDPYPLYRTIRDLGPAVWLTAHDAGPSRGSATCEPRCAPTGHWCRDEASR